MTHTPLVKSREEELEIENQKLQQENQKFKSVLEKTYHFLKNGSINSTRKIEVDVFKRVCEVLEKDFDKPKEKESSLKQGDEILYRNCVFRFHSFVDENMAIIIDSNDVKFSVDIDLLNKLFRKGDKVTLKSETTGVKYDFGHYSQTPGKAILYYEGECNMQDSFVTDISNITLVN